jgi:hypothetical protein
MGSLDADRPYVGRITIRIEHSLADDDDPQRFEVRRFSSFARAERWFKSREIENMPGRYTRPVEKCARGVCTYNTSGGINHRSLYLTKITYRIRNGCPYIKTIYLLDGISATVEEATFKTVFVMTALTIFKMEALAASGPFHRGIIPEMISFD